MKLRSLISSSIFFSVLSLAACSHAPKTQAELLNDKKQYSEYADDRLETWEDKAASIKTESRKADLLASIRDVRAELTALTTAPEGTWRSYRDRIEASLTRMNENFGLAE